MSQFQDRFRVIVKILCWNNFQLLSTTDTVYNANVNEQTLVFERGNTMSDREKLIQYIMNLTNEEAEEFISFLKTIPSSEEVSLPLHLNNSPQEQEVVA